VDLASTFNQIALLQQYYEMNCPPFQSSQDWDPKVCKAQLPCLVDLSSDSDCNPGFLPTNFLSSDQELHLVCRVPPLIPSILKGPNGYNMLGCMFQYVRDYIDGSLGAKKWDTSEDDVTSKRKIRNEAVNQFNYFGRAAFDLLRKSDFVLGFQLLHRACSAIAGLVRSECPALLVNAVDIVRLYNFHFPEVTKVIFDSLRRDLQHRTKSVGEGF
jgi:hypothetical protein